jgi:DNA mismatch repair protein MutS
VAFKSILYDEGEHRAKNAPRNAPAYFRDLNLDQIVQSVTTGKEDYDLKPFFHDSLQTADAIVYRQEIMRDLENEPVLASIKAFAASTRLVRQKAAQAEKLYYPYQKARWFLHAVETYCSGVRELEERLTGAELSSRGLRAFREYVSSYVKSNHFATPLAEATDLARDLAAIRYTVFIKNNSFTVQKYQAEPNYSDEVAATFEKFRQGAVEDYRLGFPAPVEMNQIEAKILDFVALLYEPEFSRLSAFVAQHQQYADPVLLTFDREIQFYIAYLDYIATFKRNGLGFCYPRVSSTDKAIRSEGGFDLALATKLAAAKEPIVCNDVSLTGAERILVVSGPNQGGKTTFARAFGQLHHLASIGCPVPGKNAQVFLFDSIFTHFEKEESIEDLRGKLQDDLVRFHDMLARATPRSMFIMNEIFNSTTLNDAVFLAGKVIERINELDALCVCVTFLDELASFSEKTVSMLSVVVPDNPALRTYKVVRRPADGRSYAVTIAEKYRLTYDDVKARIQA